MGIIYPKNLSPGLKALVTFLLICLSPFLIIILTLYWLWGAILYLWIWLAWRKQFALFVYSDSPTWKEYIEREIIPYIQDRAVILNWSRRRSWKISLPVLAFKYFSGYRNFNPIALVFRPLQGVKTYRFFEAFKAFKHGNTTKVEEIRNELFEILES